MLRVSSAEGESCFNADKRKKQVTLVDPTSAQSSTAEDRRPTVSAPKMFAFDAIFTEEDSQTEICSSALTDVIHAVINGTDGCLFCFGHAGLGKTYTMLGSAEAGQTLGAIPCAIAWLFRGISEQRQKTGARFSVRVSCVELTTGQQQLRDLLFSYANDSEQSPGAYLRDDPVLGTLQLHQHSELRAPTAERAALYLDAAIAARQRDDNDAHMLFTLHVYQYSVAGKGVAGGHSRLHLIEIGNSERGKSSGGIPLSGLGNILLAILNGQKHLPYKEHKLAQLLKDCLGPLTCHATMIAHVSPSCQHYSETLITCQLASRIHRMRRRKIRFAAYQQQQQVEDLVTKQLYPSSECEPSSSDLSADTVIYVGPSADDATDGEHPPVYIPSLNSGDNRCAMNRVLRGSAVEKPARIDEERSPVHKPAKLAKQMSSPSHGSTPKASPARKPVSKLAQAQVQVSTSPPSSKALPSTLTPATTGTSDEQWIDGPRISRLRVAEARHLLSDATHKRETWIDGPMQQQQHQQQYHHSHHHHQLQQQLAMPSASYGYMDSYKKSVIRKWVENQSSQIQRKQVSQFMASSMRQGMAAHLRNCATSGSSTGGGDDDDTSLSTSASESLKVSEIEDITDKIGARLNLLNVKSNTNADLDLTGSPLMDSLEQLSRTLDILQDEDEDDDEDIIVPPPLPLIEPLSNGVSREVSLESLNLSHKDHVSLQPDRNSRNSMSSEDEILEIIEVDSTQQAPMQDSCLQVTEEDIALCMGDRISTANSMHDEHPLRILSQENLTIVSTLTESLSVLSETERYRSHFPPPAGMGMQPRPYFDHEDFLEQENRHKFDQLARLHELYQSKLALANVTNSLTYQREKSFSTNVREPTSSMSGAFRPGSRCQSLSLSDVFSNDTASNHGSIYSEPAYAANKNEQDKICDNCRQSMAKLVTDSYLHANSIAHITSPGHYCSRLVDCNISNLRHPDGASNPNLKEEVERIPGNGASGSDPEEEYIEAKNLFAFSATNTGTTLFQRLQDKILPTKPQSDELLRFPSFTVPSPLPVTNLPSSNSSSIPSSGIMHRKLLSLDSSLGLNKDDYDSGADSTSRAAKLSPATLSRHRAESSGYDSVVRDSETSSLSSDSSRHTSALQEHNNGALGVLTSTLCGCFSGGTTGRVRASASSTASNRVQTRFQRRERGDTTTTRTTSHTAVWHSIRDTQPSSASASS
ncbi:kinesin-like protein CG14535 [Phymastichus coffea]|uniref:kinesin-like protein CG14535 n=1 Tax=Phymastichus coffea TaxID=108790 RepID=UPI00273C2B5F|nr:kinesin-like protein CG14535 [Phymastichus coffea]